MKMTILTVCLNLMSVVSTVGAADAVEFTRHGFREPECIYWPSYMWLWNGPLNTEVISEQLQDMRDHGAKSAYILPMPHEFRPTTSNNQMDVEYLSDEFFQ
jgi:hypothetical protein